MDSFPLSWFNCLLYIFRDLLGNCWHIIPPSSRKGLCSSLPSSEVKAGARTPPQQRGSRWESFINKELCHCCHSLMSSGSKRNSLKETWGDDSSQALLTSRATPPAPLPPLSPTPRIVILFIIQKKRTSLLSPSRRAVETCTKMSTGETEPTTPTSTHRRPLSRHLSNPQLETFRVTRSASSVTPVNNYIQPQPSPVPMSSFSTFAHNKSRSELGRGVKDDPNPYSVSRIDEFRIQVQDPYRIRTKSTIQLSSPAPSTRSSSVHYYQELEDFEDEGVVVHPYVHPDEDHLAEKLAALPTFYKRSSSGRSPLFLLLLSIKKNIIKGFQFPLNEILSHCTL